MDTGKLERIGLSDKRDLLYEKFRTNLRVIRAFKGISASEASEKIGLKHGKRLVQLEYGTANPSFEEIILITRHYNVNIDDMLNKEISYSFK